MDFKKELEEMRAAYARRPLKFETLPKPYWLTPSDGLYSVYRDKNTLFSHGQVYYAYLVQANKLLFDFWSFDDCPANLIYSTSHETENDPFILRGIAQMLFSFKNKPPEEIPPAFREVAAVITDEHDRAGFIFSCSNDNGKSIDMRFLAFMVFRKHLPTHVLKGGLFPILAAPGHCAPVMILPKKYWTKEFTEAWKKQLL